MKKAIVIMSLLFVGSIASADGHHDQKVEVVKSEKKVNCNRVAMDEKAMCRYNKKAKRNVASFDLFKGCSMACGKMNSLDIRLDQCFNRCIKNP